MEVVASLSQGRTAAAQCGLFIHKSVPVIFEPPCIYTCPSYIGEMQHSSIISCDFTFQNKFLFFEQNYLITVPDFSPHAEKLFALYFSESL